MSQAMTTNVSWEYRLDNFYYEASDVHWRTRKCTKCEKADWNSQIPTFFKIDIGCFKIDIGCLDCGARCSDCLLDVVKTNHSSNSST
eukprot:UN09725